MRTVSIKLLAQLRETRSQAISLARNIQFSLDTTTKMYSVIIQKYTLIDPLDPNHVKVMSEQEAKTLASNVQLMRITGCDPPALRPRSKQRQNLRCGLYAGRVDGDKRFTCWFD